MSNTQFAVSFKGGFARGLGNLGFVRFLQEENLLPSIYAGSSMGALIATGFCLGIEWKDMIKEAENIKIRSLLSPSSFLSQRKFVSFSKFTKLLSSIAKIDKPDLRIEDLENKLVVFTSSLDTCSRVLLTKGPLFESLAASCGIPFAFENNQELKHLTDGDFTNSYSAQELKALGAKTVIGLRYHSDKKIYNTPAGIYRLLMTQISNFNDLHNPVDLELYYLAEDHSMLDFKVSYLVDAAYEVAKSRKQEILDLLQN